MQMLGVYWKIQDMGTEIFKIEEETKNGQNSLHSLDVPLHFHDLFYTLV